MLLGPATIPRGKEVEKPTLRSPSLEMISDVQRGLTSEGVPWEGRAGGGSLYAPSEDSQIGYFLTEFEARGKMDFLISPCSPC